MNVATNPPMVNPASTVPAAAPQIPMVNPASTVPAAAPQMEVAAAPADLQDEGEHGSAESQGRTELIAKWGAENIKWGWVAFPKIILEKQHALGLEPLDINIILQIARCWYTAGNLPWPSKATIAKAINVHPRTVQRRLAHLVKLGFLTKIERKGGPKGTLSSQYNLAGLAEKAKPYALEALQERERQREETIERLKRKRPKPQAKGDK